MCSAQLQDDLVTTQIPHSTAILKLVDSATTTLMAEKGKSARKSDVKGKGKAVAKTAAKRKKDEGDSSDVEPVGKKAKARGGNKKKT